MCLIHLNFLQMYCFRCRKQILRPTGKFQHTSSSTSEHYFQKHLKYIHGITEESKKPEIHVMGTEIITNDAQPETICSQTELLKCPMRGPPVFCDFVAKSASDLRNHSHFKDTVSSKSTVSAIKKPETVKKIKDSKEKPMLKSMFWSEEQASHSSNFLGDILSQQNDFFKPKDRSNIVPNEPKKLKVKDLSYFLCNEFPTSFRNTIN